MKKIVLALAMIVSSLSFADSVDGVVTPHAKKEKNKKYSTLICDVRKNAIRVGEPAAVRLQAAESGEVEVVIKTVTNLVENTKRYDSQVDSINMNVSDLPQGFVKNRLISFKKVKDLKPFASNDQYFIYLKKSFPSSIKMTVINKQNGVKTVLPKCFVDNKFLTKVIKL